jgi:hypothetical protein
VNIDTELETWRREWRDETEPLPDLKEKIKRQNLRMVASAVMMMALLAASTTMALRTRGSFVSGLASGLWAVSVVVGSYAWWVRRGTWKPVAQTTLAYLKLTHNRAVANARVLRFSFYFLLVTIVLFGAGAVWHGREFSALTAVILAALVAELGFLWHLGRRKRRAIERIAKLIEQTRE